MTGGTETQNLSGITTQVSGLWRLARPHRRRVYLTLLFVVGFGLWEGVVLSLALPVINTIVSGVGGPAQEPSGYFGAVFDAYELIPEGARESLGIVVLMAMEIVRGVISYFTLVLQSTLATTVIVTRRSDILSNIMSARLSFFDRTRSGYLFQVTSTEMVFLSEGMTSLVSLFAASTRALVTVGIMAALSWQLVLIFLAFAGLNGLLTIVIGGRVQRNADIALGGRTALMTDLNEATETIRQHKSLATEGKAVAAMSASSATAEWRGRRQKLLTAALSPISLIVGLAAIATVVVVSVNFSVFDSGDTEVAGLLLFLLMMLRLGPVLSETARHYANVKGVGPSLERVNALIHLDESALEPSGGERPEPLFENEIRFEQVNFTYENGSPALRDINLDIASGRTTAIVGASGSGKSTLVDLLTRFYEPQEGRMLFDGIDARRLDLRHLRQRIGYVSQESVLFTDTVAENLRAGRPGATDDEIIKAARQANAHDFIVALPDGYDTVLGERGSSLSEGQRQRIAIAQALVKQPDLLILDEPTSALDPVSELQIQQTLDELKAGRTVIVIAHRLSTVKDADVILVMKDGAIVETGAWPNLMDAKGELWRLARGEESESSGERARG